MPIFEGAFVINHSYPYNREVFNALSPNVKAWFAVLDPSIMSKKNL